MSVFFSRFPNVPHLRFCFFFLKNRPPTEISPLPLPAALPISAELRCRSKHPPPARPRYVHPHHGDVRPLRCLLARGRVRHPQPPCRGERGLPPVVPLPGRR